MVDITEISAMVATVGLLVGVVYYILEIRQQTKIRQTDLVMRLYSQFSSPEFQKVYFEIQKREALNYHDYERKYGLSDVTTIGIFFEGIGILLKRKLVDIELVDDMFTTPVKQTWERMKDKTLEARKIRNQPEIFEWFEYLYNELKKREQQLQPVGVKSS